MTLRRKPAEENGYSTFKRRKPKPSKRSQDPVTPEVYAAVFGRDGDCLLRHSQVPAFATPCSGPHQWAHRVAVTYGGPSTPSNGTRLCQHHHGRIDGVYRAEARALGLRLRRGEDPSQVLITLTDGRRVRLSDDGRYLEAGT